VAQESACAIDDRIILVQKQSNLYFGWPSPIVLLILVISTLACTDHRPEKEFQQRLDTVLVASWAFYKTHYILPDGRVKRPDNQDDTVSEGQAYALLRAVWSDDQATFDRCYSWTENHLSQKTLKGRNLLAWHWGQDEPGHWGLLDANSATDADLDYALALVLAHRRWSRPSQPLPDYLLQAKLVLQDILDRETCRDPWGRLWLTPGDWVECQQPLLLNPSYFSPAWYQLFFELTRDRRWLELAGSTYAGLELMSRRLGEQPGAGLIPDWCLLSAKQQCVPAPGQSAAFGWDAIRIPWRLSLASLWFQDPHAKNFLAQTFIPFCRAQWQTHGRIYAIYDYAGQPAAPYDSPVLYASLVGAALAVGDQTLAKQAVEKILSFYHETNDGGYFNRPDDYYGNNWAWFGLATYRGIVSP
jgi:endoglucanase